MRASILFIIFILFSTGIFCQNEEIEHLQKIIQQDREDSNKVMHLNTLIYLLRESGDMKNALFTGIQSTTLALKINNPNGLANAYNNIGGIYREQSNYKVALDYYDKALKIADSLGNPIMTATLANNMATIYTYQGNLPKALELDLQALNMAEKRNSKPMVARVTSSLGNIYMSDKNYDKALDYYFKAIKLDEELNDRVSLAYAFSNVGETYSRQGKYKEALNYYKKTLQRIDEGSNRYFYAECLARLGKAYSAEGNYSAAINAFDTSLSLQSRMKDRLGVAANYNNLGNAYLRLKKYKRAENYLLEGVKIADSLKAYEFIKDGNEYLGALFKQTGQWQKALEATEKMNKAKDTLYGVENSKQIGRLEAKYEYDRDSAIQQANYANQLAIKQSEAEKKAAESKTQKIITGLLAVVVLILIVLIFQRMKGAEKEKLIAQKQRSWLELKALRTQMNPHFLYNTINSIQSLILENDKKSSSIYLSKFAILIRGVLENSRKDNITLGEEIDGLTNYIDFEAMRFPDKFMYSIEVDERLDKSKNLLPPLLIQPHVENALWHGLMHKDNGAGQLTVKFEKKDNHIMCIIEDNGIGRKAAAEIMKKSTHKSVGLSIVNERMESMNQLYHWDMKVEMIDKINKDGTPGGTRVEMLFPFIPNKFVYA